MRFFKKHQKFFLVAFSLLLVLAGFIYTNTQAKSFIKAALLMPEFIQRNDYAGWGQIFNLTPSLSTVSKKPIVMTVNIATPQGPILADLWLPNDGEKQHGVVITNLGVRVDRKDPRSTFIADKIARLGIGVLLPDLPGLLSARSTPSDSEYLVATFKYLEQQPYVKKDKIGFLAFCGASVISLIAAENPEINTRVSYVAINNLFYNPDTLYQALVAAELTNDKGKKVSWLAHPRTVEVLNRELVSALENEFDRQTLTAYLVNQPEEVLASRNFPEIPATTSAKLSEDGKKVYRLLTNKDPKLSQPLLFQLPEEVSAKTRYKMTAVPNIENLKTHLFLIVDRGNTYLPFTDAAKFVTHLSEKQYTLVETDLLKNSLLIQDLNLAKAVTEGVKILFFVTSLVSQAS